MLRKTPESLDAVNVIPGSCVDQGLAMADRMVLPQTFQRIIASERVGIVDRSLLRFLPDNRHQLFLGDVLDNPCINPPIAFQKAKYHAFASCATSPLSFASAAKVGLVNFNLSVQFFSFKPRNVIDRFSKTLVDSRGSLIIKLQILRQAVGGLLLVEASYYGNFLSQLFQRFLFSTGFIPASHIPSFGFIHLKRTAEYALATSQKVGRTTENVVSCSNHKGILTPHGYESN